MLYPSIKYIHLDSKRSSPSLLARQLRLRLVAGDESDVPRNLHNIVVSIHAIATFQALHDYLRPRVAGLLSSGSRLSGMFAALAASGFVGSSKINEEPSKTTPAPTGTNTSGDPATNQHSVTRRRSQRLSAKNGGPSIDDSPSNGQSGTNSNAALPTEGAVSEPGPNTVEAAASDTLVDSELQADFSDDEVDAEVFDDDLDPDNSVSDKTVTLSVAEGKAKAPFDNNNLTVDHLDGSKVEAQTPDGTRVATPGASSKDGQLNPTPRNLLSSRASYAAALKAKPTDWHLEFSMDDHILPLDLTIYGAIHQHEMRKKTGSLPHSMIWQGVYTIKFKKVSGPASPTDSEFIFTG